MVVMTNEKEEDKICRGVCGECVSHPRQKVLYELCSQSVHKVADEALLQRA